MKEVFGLSSTGMNILAGATLGGGTRVNWQASFKTPSHVRQEWAEQHGLPDIASDKFDRTLDAVCTRLGVTTGALLVMLCGSLIHRGICFWKSSRTAVQCNDLMDSCLFQKQHV